MVYVSEKKLMFSFSFYIVVRRVGGTGGTAPELAEGLLSLVVTVKGAQGANQRGEASVILV